MHKEIGQLKKINIVNGKNFCFSISRRETVIILLVFLLNLFLVLHYLTPSYLEINADDGAKYIESGRKLLIWGLRDLSWGPLVAFVYAPLHIFLHNSPNWFMLEAWIGNVTLFSLMWFSFYLLARQLNESLSISVFIGLLFSWVGYHHVLYNQSDALFLPLSVFALTHIFRFRHERKIKNIWMASLFLGLGMLTRVETVILVIPLLFFSIWFNKKKHQLFQVVLAGLVPMIGVFLIFIFINVLTFGHLNLGMSGKSYFSYTHPLVQNFLPGSKNQQAYLQGDPIFGTLEENQNSLIRTILINPSVLFERIIANLLDIPDMLGQYFGIFIRNILIFFGFLGLYHLVNSKDYEILLVLLVWPLHALVALVFETLHFIPQISYIFLILPGIGITFILSHQAGKKVKIMVILLSLLMIVASLLSHKYSWLASGILILIVALINFLIQSHNDQKVVFKLLPAVVLLTGMLFFQKGFVFPSLIIGQSEDEIAVHELQTNLSFQSNILAMNARPAVAAKMEHIRYPETIDEVGAFIRFLVNKNIAAIYYDDKLHFSTNMMDIALDEFPQLFELIHQSKSRSIRIYRFDYSSH